MSALLEAVLFDLDGTLIDSIELIRRSYGHTLHVHGKGELDEARWLAGLGRPLRSQFEQLTEDAGEVEAMIRTYREWNAREHDALVRPYPGIAAALDVLRARSLRLGVVTSKARAAAWHGLEHTGLAGYFDVLVGADDVQRHKPDPAPVCAALEQLAVAPGAAAYVGDSPHDIASGRAAGTRTAAVLWGPFGRRHLVPERPDRWLETPAEIGAL